MKSTIWLTTVAFFLLWAVVPLQAIEYFDVTQLIQHRQVRFPQAGALQDSLILLYQEVVPSEADGGVIYLKGMRSDTGQSWSDSRRLTPAIPYQSESPPIIFSTVFHEDEILLAISESSDEIGIYRITQLDLAMERIQGIQTDGTLVAPRLFRSDEGSFYLLANRHRDFRIDIYIAASQNAETWESFERFSVLDNQTLNFNPSHVHYQGRDIIVYQALDPTVAGAYQLYIRYSENNGLDWSPPVQITDFAAGGNEPGNYDNQRPELYVYQDQLIVVWERRFGNQTRHVYLGSLDDNLLFGTRPEQVSTGFSNTNAPFLFEFSNEKYIVWTQSRSEGDQVVVAWQEGLNWITRVINQRFSGSAAFPRFVEHRGRLHVFWQNRRAEQTGIAHLPPDQHVDPPSLAALDFTAGARSRQTEVRIRVDPPDDPSGIVGYSYVWGGNPIPMVPSEQNLNPGEQLRLNTNRDGRWFLHVRAHDAAGNWSRPATISYVRDTVPPPPVSFADIDTDADGFVTSNTFTVEWVPPDDPNVVGYSYRYQRFGPVSIEIDEIPTSGLRPPPAAINTRDTRFRRVNEDDGVWVLTVVAVDDVGNRSEPAHKILPLNKYIPVTIVRMVDAEVDNVGRVEIAIAGRGFRAEGFISDIILEDVATGEETYRFRYANGDYRIPDDRTIRGITVARPLPGEYRIRLLHTSRGEYRITRLLEIETTGTIKFGDFTLVYQPDWSIRVPTGSIILSYGSIWFWLIMLLLLVAAAGSAMQLMRITAESRAIRIEAAALLQGEVMKLSAPGNKKLQRAARRGAGLRIKFTVFAALLVTSVVLMVAITLGTFVLDTQSRTLSQGLQDRVEVLLDSIVTASAGFLPAPEGNVPELNTLANQIAVMPEAIHATITGRGRADASQFNYIWATNDPKLTDGLVRGETVLEDDLTPTAARMEQRINEEARQVLGDIAQQIDNFTADIISLALDDSRQAERQRQEIDTVRSELETRLLAQLNEIGGSARSLPEFEVESLSGDQTEYIFYQPVLYRNPNEDVYYRGMVRMGVSTELILQEIAASQRTLIFTTVVIALIAVAVGVFGALLLATIIIIPINKLVRGVEKIRMTEDKRQLKDHRIQVKTRDELNVLAESVNLMTQGLVKAAEASEELTIGKEVQKMFIPLTQKDNKTKYSTGKHETDAYEFFGYYEGAKTVSGDYFTFSQLDPQNYALIKCDVAGKGVPAALIMVEVATLFLHHFRDWNNPTLAGKALLNRRAQLRDLNSMLISLNDLLETTALAGRFAALTVGTLNIHENQMVLANAGDNQLHMYRAQEHKTMQYEMADAPAAGVFSSDFIPNGYRSSTFQLEIGDIVLFFTDGLEEAKRILRDREYRPKQLDDGVGDEEFSIPRIHEATEAIQSRSSYKLVRQDNPTDEELVFDFSAIEPTAENTVLGLIAIEKVFRCYPDPQSTASDKVLIDRVVDDFLKKTFSAYDVYFSQPVEGVDNSTAEYRQYAYIKEDEQYDDLTLLAIRRKL